MLHFTMDQFTYVVKVAGGVGSFVVFCIAVSTYYRTERWKRAEFLAHEMKEFFATGGVQKAMLLIDWGERRIRLLENVPDDQAVVSVNRPMQVRGLRPHILVTGDESSDSDSMVVKDGADSDRFTQPEAAIRDCYDAFLDGLERFGSYVKTGLTDVASLRPYIGYWIDDISEPTSSPDDAAWNAALLPTSVITASRGGRCYSVSSGRTSVPNQSCIDHFLLPWPAKNLLRLLHAPLG
jgi:hypothetical protein